MTGPARTVLLAAIAPLALLCACRSSGDRSAGGSAASPGASASSAPAADHHAPTVFQVTHQSHRGVIRLDVGDSFEIPDEATSNYRAELSDPSLFRTDTATHYTAIASGPSRLLVWVDPICHEADAAACGRSRERWSVQLLVR
jgi:hypothetical protein